MTRSHSIEATKLHLVTADFRKNFSNSHRTDHNFVLWICAKLLMVNHNEAWKDLRSNAKPKPAWILQMLNNVKWNITDEIECRHNDTIEFQIMRLRNMHKWFETFCRLGGFSVYCIHEMKPMRVDTYHVYSHRAVCISGGKDYKSIPKTTRNHLRYSQFILCPFVRLSQCIFSGLFA